jgi:hypothetical protein
VQRLLAEERARAAAGLPADNRLQEAAELLATVALSPELPPFLTVPAYDRLVSSTAS